MIAVPATADLLNMTPTMESWVIGPIRRTVINRLPELGQDNLAHTAGSRQNGWGLARRRAEQPRAGTTGTCEAAGRGWCNASAPNRAEAAR